MIRRSLVIALLLMLASPAMAQAREAAADLLARAERALSEANAIARDEPDRAAELEREAAAAYRTLIDEMGYDTAALHRNLGAVHVRLGELGRGIASLRRAQRLAPSDRQTRETLAAARARVGSLVEDNWQERGVDAALFWRPYVRPSTLLVAAASLWASGWLALAARATTERRRLGPPAVTALIVAVVLGASVGLERWVTASRRGCVVVLDGVIARRGPSEAVFEPVFEQPLSEGVEAELLERRDGWVRLRLANGLECWAPERAVEPI